MAMLQYARVSKHCDTQNVEALRYNYNKYIDISQQKSVEILTLLLIITTGRSIFPSSVHIPIIYVTKAVLPAYSK